MFFLNILLRYYGILCIFVFWIHKSCCKIKIGHQALSKIENQGSKKKFFSNTHHFESKISGNAFKYRWFGSGGCCQTPTTTPTKHPPFLAPSLHKGRGGSYGGSYGGSLARFYDCNLLVYSVLYNLQLQKWWVLLRKKVKK